MGLSSLVSEALYRIIWKRILYDIVTSELVGLVLQQQALLEQLLVLGEVERLKGLTDKDSQTSSNVVAQLVERRSGNCRPSTSAASLSRLWRDHQWGVTRRGFLGRPWAH